ncbi:MAG: hypothetical protein WA715_08745 [Candidatus Acidiferrum sp.]
MRSRITGRLPATWGLTPWGGSKATAHFLMVTYGFGVEAPGAIGATQDFQV